MKIIPDATNVLQQDITGLGPEITSTGMSLINYIGGTTIVPPGSTPAFEDTLTVEKGKEDGFITVVGSTPSETLTPVPIPPPPSDLVTSSSLPPINFGDLKTFVANTNGGSNTVTFKPAS